MTRTLGLSSRPRQGTLGLALAFLAHVALAAQAFAQPAQSPAGDVDLPEVARGVPQGGKLRVTGLALGRREKVDLELERVAVFDRDVVVVGADRSDLPDNAYFRGTMAGRPNSTVALTVPAKGKMRGLAISGDSTWMLGSDPRGRTPGLQSRKVRPKDLKNLPPFECGVDQHAELAIGGDDTAALPRLAALPANVTNCVGIAIETDAELYNKFGTAEGTLGYVGDIINFTSSIYEAEANTCLHIPFVRIWPNGTASDPWTVTSGTDNALYEYQDYWNANETGVERAIGHMLSGRPLGGGIAYLGVVCNSTYGYGLSASLTGNFDINSPAGIWDSFVIPHEIGHNFSSSHTQDYCGIGGVSQPVDLCYTSANGCGNAIGLPGLNSLSGGTTSQRPGTIMSYCHQVSGGLSNINLTLGLGHPYGIAADRVPNRMYAHVLSRDPACVALVTQDPQLTVEKIGGGTGRVTGDGIDCGNDCAQTYPEGTVVALTASADAGSVFVGWGGDCSSDGVVTVDVDRTCSAEFASLCGNGVLDAGEACDGIALAPGSSCGGCIGTPGCTASCELDLSACEDGVCSVGETCATCAQDCISGDLGGAVCGNGICEAGDGEDCVSCAADCAGRQGGKPSRRYCCGDGDGQNPVPCSDPVCGGASACTTTSTPGGSFCCGDGTCTADSPEDGFTCEQDCGPPPPEAFCGDALCNGNETSCTCAQDCGTPPATEADLCSDGQDNDCDGLIDAADAVDCPSTCLSSGELCSTASDCCSGSCRKRRGIRSCR